MSVPQLRFKEFSGAWVEKRIGEITCKVGSGSTPRGGEEVYQSYGIPFIRSQNVNDERLVLNDITYISDEMHSQMKGSVVKPNDILLNITGASIGRSCVVPLDFSTGNVNQHVCIIRLKSEYIPRFLQPYLSSSRGQKSISSTQVGSGREGLNFEAIRSFKVFIPKLDEQTKIANFLTAVDEKLSQLARKHNLLTQYKKGVMQKLFSQELRFKDDGGREFPAWQAKTLGDLTTLISRRNSKLIKAEVYSVTNSNGFVLQSEQFEDRVVAGTDLSGYKIIRRGEFAYNPARVNVGSIALFGNEIGIISSLYVCFKCSPDLSNEFLLHFLELESTKANICSFGEGGVRIYLWYPLFARIPLVLPSHAEQTKIANFLTSIDDKIATTKTQLEAVKQYKQGLLQQMFV